MQTKQTGGGAPPVRRKSAICAALLFAPRPAQSHKEVMAGLSDNNRRVDSNLKVQSGAALLGQGLKSCPAQDRIDGVTHLAPNAAHRTALAALTQGICRTFFQTVDRNILSFDYVNYVRHGDFGGMTGQHITAIGTFLADQQASTLQFEEQAAKVILRNVL